MKILLLACSQRKESNSARVCAYAEQQLKEQGHSVDTFDLGKTPLPMWSESLAEKGGDANVERVKAQATEADALVCAVPEYSGMAAPAFKNFILMMSDEQLGHKPALLVGVSAGAGGVYPIAELRMSSYKNVRLLWIPENVIVRRAGDFPDTDHEETVARMRYALELLVKYGEAMREVREGLGAKPYPFGV